MGYGKPRPKDEEMMALALNEARLAIAEGKAGVGALLLWHDEILALTHNMFFETRDMTDHAEMAALRKAARRLSAMSDQERGEITIYVTLQPCLMCLSAISFLGIKRTVYSALNEDGQERVEIVHGLSIEQINNAFVRGPIELVPGVLREEGIRILHLMGKAATQPTPKGVER